MFDAMQYAVVNEERSARSGGSDFEATWYEVDVSEMYPAVIDFLTDNMAAIGALFRESDAVLFNKAMQGDGLAAFVVQARQTAAIVLSVPDAAWRLALEDRAELPDDKSDPAVLMRAQALEAARLFFTEAHHQATNFAPRSLHLLMPDRGWRLDAEGY